MTEWSISYKVALAVDVVADLTGLDPAVIAKSNRRFGHIMAARKLAIMLCRKFLGLQYKEIIGHINGDQSTLVRHYRNGVVLVKRDPDYRLVWEMAADKVLSKIRERTSYV